MSQLITKAPWWMTAPRQPSGFGGTGLELLKGGEQMPPRQPHQLGGLPPHRKAMSKLTTKASWWVTTPRQPG